jgi:hypothetical protein
VSSTDRAAPQTDVTDGTDRETRIALTAAAWRKKADEAEAASAAPPSVEDAGAPNWKEVAQRAKVAGDRVLQDAKVSPEQLQRPYFSAAHNEFVAKHGWPQPAPLSVALEGEIRALRTALKPFVDALSRNDSARQRYVRQILLDNLGHPACEQAKAALTRPQPGGADDKS